MHAGCKIDVCGEGPGEESRILDLLTGIFVNDVSIFVSLLDLIFSRSLFIVNIFRHFGW